MAIFCGKTKVCSPLLTKIYIAIGLIYSVVFVSLPLAGKRTQRYIFWIFLVKKPIFSGAASLRR
jgi:hypothetical protein